MSPPIPHLFECWPAIARRLRRAPSVALFLDFDGTLAKIAPRPSQAVLPIATRRRLVSLAKHRSVQVCVISGRDRATLRKLVAVPRVRCLGLYGWQNGQALALDRLTQKTLALAREAVTHRVRPLQGIWVEDKRQAFSVHYRGAPQSSVRLARLALRAAALPFRLLRVIPAKKGMGCSSRVLCGKGRGRAARASSLAPKPRHLCRRRLRR
jgi:trehalose 6-phosphate phosphatase